MRSISTVAPSPAPAPWQQGLEPRPSFQAPRSIIWKRVTGQPGALHQQHMIPTPKAYNTLGPGLAKQVSGPQGITGGEGPWVGRVRGLIQGLGATGFRCLPAVIKSNMKPTGGQKRRRWLTGGLGTSEDLPPRTQGDRASPEGTAPCQLDSPQLMSPCCGAGLGQRKQRWARKSLARREFGQEENQHSGPGILAI